MENPIIYIYIYMALCTFLASIDHSPHVVEAVFDGILWPVVIPVSIIRRIIS